MARVVRAREVSAQEVMAAHLRQIDLVNPRVNAIVSKLPNDQCLALAAGADRKMAKGEPVGPLHGLPIAIKDTEPAVGFPFTRGSAIYKDDMPAGDSVIVERLRAAGMLVIGKTNVPEFGMGSHTYNELFGATVNPYDLTKSAGGSSGGAAAALATGLMPFANGSDLGGSLRNPANFNNVVALRPTVGLVPISPAPMSFGGFLVKGPMARSVSDTAFLLSAIAGSDPRDPWSYPCDPVRFSGELGREFDGVRVAWCPDLGGLPLDRRVRAVLEAQRATFEDLGCQVEEASPDLRGAEEIFLTLRFWQSSNALGPLLDVHRERLKPEAVWELEAGARLSGKDVAGAMSRHVELLDRVRRFQQTYAFILCAVNQVPPFDAGIDWPREIEGAPMENYVAWMKSAYLISVTLCPAISVPAGFTPDGLPVGIQIVGRHRDDLGVLQMAYAFEEATSFGLRRPPIDR